jgi:hypothetical protein
LEPILPALDFSPKALSPQSGDIHIINTQNKPAVSRNKKNCTKYTIKNKIILLKQS